MKTDIAVTIRVPENAQRVLAMLAEQNMGVTLEINQETREITLSGYMLDYPTYSNDGGWAEINDFLEGVE